ncbi:uncharacterized protein LAESUDRAFT_747733 [Laetiporus sulphureus 93-53]|uniref:Uncharacterized protein n=1 Tax=Laetiporus sulphureus 93-53 TaxID=1314785 RepID=A0A165GI29_9APHY|nr:uncharacterized protein LAESUDRAFT_747733 [Laetiporus sulphureus 93-53]KZT10379.1 hypothetical protein LAESUDRAFT_747733 [Laetiporus sulphureus 93-53]
MAKYVEVGSHSGPLRILSKILRAGRRTRENVQTAATDARHTLQPEIPEACILSSSRPAALSTRLIAMSYVILGRVVKSEYIALASIGTVAGIAALKLGGKKEAAPVGSGPSSLEQAKSSVKINAGSSEEEQLVNSIKKYIEEAEKESKH